MTLADLCVSQILTILPSYFKIIIKKERKLEQSKLDNNIHHTEYYFLK